MSEDVQRWATQRPDTPMRPIHTSGIGEVEVGPASAFDAVVAERDRLADEVAQLHAARVEWTEDRARVVAERDAARRQRVVSLDVAEARARALEDAGAALADLIEAWGRVNAVLGEADK